MKSRVFLALLAAMLLLPPAVRAGSPPGISYGLLGAANGVAQLSSTKQLVEQQVPRTLYTIEQMYYSDPGMVAMYLMAEGSGTQLTDSNPVARGVNTVSFSGVSSPPTWGNGGLNWVGGTTSAIPLPTAIGSNIQWYHFAVVNAVQLGNDIGSTAATPVYNSPIAYGGSGISGQSLEFTQGYDCESLANVGFGTKFLSYAQNTPGNCVGTFAEIDDSFHVIDVVFNQTALTYTVYMDGVLESKTSSAITVAALASGGVTYLGGAPYTGNTACAVGTCGFGGEITEAEFSTTIPTQAEISQDYAASVALANYKGVSSAPYTAPYASPFVVYCKGESQTWGNGLSTPSSQSFCAQLTTSLTSTYGVTFTMIKDGVNNNSGYTMSNTTLAPECIRDVTAVSQAGNKNLDILWDNSNSERHYLGYLSGGAAWGAPYNTSVTSEAMADINAEDTCAATIHALGDYSMIGTYPSNDANANADVNIKDVVNPLIRKFAAKSFDVVFVCSDARFCADGAAVTNQTGTACYGNPCYQSGGVHPTFYGDEVLEADMLDAVARLFNSSDPETVSATSYPMVVTDIGRNITLTGTSAALTLMPCAGLPSGYVIATIKNSGSAADTITPGTEFGGGTQDLINGSATYSLPVSSATSSSTQFVAEFNGDVAGTCYVAANPQ